MADRLVLLHLSDIHFRKWSGAKYDLDADIRNELLLDAQAVVAEPLEPPDAVLIGGDIAFGGSQKEYDTASQWLRQLCEGVGCEFGHVYAVPGNHDVDQPYVKASYRLTSVHDRIRNADEKQVNEQLTLCLGDRAAAQELFASIGGFNMFAQTFGCQSTAMRPNWSQDLILNDGSTLRLWGLNSTLISDHLDNQAKHVALGAFQLPPRVSGVCYATICHHPPTWWREDDTEEILDDRVSLQLFGHKHRQRADQINNCVRVTAGAVHPDPREPGWQPRYNWITLQVAETSNARMLYVEVFPRVWTSRGRFGPDTNACGGGASKLFRVRLDPWRRASSPRVAPPQQAVLSADTIASLPKPKSKPMDAARVLTYRFFGLPHVTRLEIANRLKLMQNDDEGIPDHELFQRVFIRASADKSILARLWDEVETAYSDGKYPLNPFRNTGS